MNKKSKADKRRYNSELTGSEYAQMFQEYISEGKEILNRSKTESLLLEDGEIFVQCYADTPARRLFPPYWFVSDTGNLVSMKTGKPVWIKQNERESGSKFYMFGIKDEYGNHVQYKNVEVHNLVALVHGSDVFGQAEALLKEDGLQAFGVKSKVAPKAQGHHKDGDHSNNRPENIQILTSDMHTVLEKAPLPAASDKKVFDYLRELSDQLQIEAPNKPVIVFDGYTYNKKNGEYKKNSDSYARVMSNITYEQYLALMRACYNSMRSAIDYPKEVGELCESK